MSSPVYARWEVFVSVVGVLTALPLLATLVMIQLPSRKVDSLFKTLDATEGLLQESIEEGVLCEHHIRAFREQLAHLRNRAREVRARAHSARDWIEDLKNLLQGLTATITTLEDEVKETRATIATTSTREREERARVEEARRLAAEGGAGTQDATTSNIGLLPTMWRLLKSTPHLVARVLLWRPKSPSTGNERSSRLTGYEQPPAMFGGHSSAPYIAPPVSPLSASLPSLPGDTPHVVELVPGNVAQARGFNAPSPELSGRPSSQRRKIRASPWSRTRVFTRFVRHYHRKYSTSSGDDEVMLIPMADLSPIQPLHTDDEADEWEDVVSRTVRAVS